MVYEFIVCASLKRCGFLVDSKASAQQKESWVDKKTVVGNNTFEFLYMFIQENLLHNNDWLNIM